MDIKAIVMIIVLITIIGLYIVFK